jgi:hypothetical protein
MKFAILDARKRDDHYYSSTTYKYLDELLDKTFITDYFLDRTSASASAPTKP